MNMKIVTSAGMLAVALLFSMQANAKTKRIAAIQPKEATLGELFEINLPSSPGTGYVWYYLMPGAGAPVEFVSVSSKAISGSKGGPAEQSWMFMPRNEGTWLLTFAYKGPGKKESVDKLQYFEVKVAPKAATAEELSSKK